MASGNCSIYCVETGLHPLCICVVHFPTLFSIAVYNCFFYPSLGDFFFWKEKPSCMCVTLPRCMPPSLPPSPPLQWRNVFFSTNWNLCFKKHLTTAFPQIRRAMTVPHLCAQRQYGHQVRGSGGSVCAPLWNRITDREGNKVTSRPLLRSAHLTLTITSCHRTAE